VLNTGIVVSMSKSPRVTFKYKRVSENDWQIEAHYAGAEIRYIKNLRAKPDGEGKLLQGDF
jgi:hypothetical protein